MKKKEEPVGMSESSIRVLVVGPHPPPTGGIATVVRNVLSIDFGSNIETRLFDVREFKRPSNVVYRVLNRISSRLPPSGVWALVTRYLLCAFREALADYQPHVVHIHASHGYGFWSAAPMMQVAKAAGAKVIFHSHGSSMDVFYDGLSSSAQAYYRRCLARADLVIALSEAWYGWFSQFVTETQLDVLPNCIDWSKFQRGNPGRVAAPPKVLFVGVMFGARKGIHDLIAVVPQVLDVHPDARFVLVGSDDEEVEMTMQVDARTRAALDFTGNLDQEGVAQAYADATCFVLPAYHEGMPMVMLESMAAGAPNICTAINAIPEVITHEQNGLLLEPGDQDALAAHILRLLGDAAFREKIGEAGRDFIEERHNLARQQGWLSEIYTRITEGRGSRRS